MGGFGSGNWYRFGTKDAVEEYCALFGTSASKEAEAEHSREAHKQRKEESERRQKGYEWLFE